MSIKEMWGLNCPLLVLCQKFPFFSFLPVSSSRWDSTGVRLNSETSVPSQRPKSKGFQVLCSSLPFLLLWITYKDQWSVKRLVWFTIWHVQGQIKEMKSLSPQTLESLRSNIKSAPRRTRLCGRRLYARENDLAAPFGGVVNEIDILRYQLLCA